MFFCDGVLIDTFRGPVWHSCDLREIKSVREAIQLALLYNSGAIPVKKIIAICFRNSYELVRSRKTAYSH